MVSQGIATLDRNSLPSPARGTYVRSSVGTITTVPAVFIDEAPEREYVSRLWAADWESPEDAIFDE